MSENHPDDMDSIIENLGDSSQETSESASADADAEFGTGDSDERPQDTAKEDSVQAQEASGTEKSAGNDRSYRSKHGESFLDELLRDPEDATQINWGRKEVKKADDGQLLEHLARSQLDLNELMAWKEELRLLTVSYMVPGPYYDSWTKEANLFFRRLVIIKKRLETQKKQKRA